MKTAGNPEPSRRRNKNKCNKEVASASSIGENGGWRSLRIYMTCPFLVACVMKLLIIVMDDDQVTM